MINRQAILEWSEDHPWQSKSFVEQDLIICRAVVAIFSDEFLCRELAWRPRLPQRLARHPATRRRVRPQNRLTLDGGHYIQPKMHLKPILGPAPNSALTSTNAIERQFQRMLVAKTRRYPVYIQGKGTLKCPDITFCEVHLGSGGKFITSGRFKPDGYAIKESAPPPDADWDNRIGYPAYVVEPGAKLIFTENDAYPSALIR